MQTDLHVEILMIFIKTLYSTKKCVGGQMDRIINRLMDRQTDRCMDRQTGGQNNGLMKGMMNLQMDRPMGNRVLN